MWTSEALLYWELLSNHCSPIENCRIQLGLISPTSLASLLLCLCLLAYFPFLVPASLENEGFPGYVPTPGSPLFSSCTEPSLTLIHNVERGSQEEAWSDSGKGRRKKQSKHSGKEREGERIWWRMDKIFIALQERAAADHGSEGTLSTLPTRQMGNSPTHIFSLLYREYFHTFILMKKCLYFTHIYIFAITKQSPQFCRKWKWGVWEGQHSQ